MRPITLIGFDHGLQRFLGDHGLCPWPGVCGRALRNSRRRGEPSTGVWSGLASQYPARRCAPRVVGAGHEGGGFLVPHLQEADAVLAHAQRLHHAVNAVARQAEHHLHLPVYERVDQDVRSSGHGGALCPMMAGPTPEAPRGGAGGDGDLASVGTPRQPDRSPPSDAKSGVDREWSRCSGPPPDPKIEAAMRVSEAIVRDVRGASDGGDGVRRQLAIYSDNTRATTGISGTSTAGRD